MVAPYTAISFIIICEAIKLLNIALSEFPLNVVNAPSFVPTRTLKVVSLVVPATIVCVNGNTIVVLLAAGF